MSQYLFLFTIGPVQSFIAQARKTQDLYASSYFLSYLIDLAMDEIQDQVNYCEFIFPDKNIRCKPNRFIVKIDTDDVENTGRSLKKTIKNELENHGNALLNEVIEENLTYNFMESFRRQKGTHFHIDWIALPVDENNYANTYGQLENYLGAIKNVRSFQQLAEEGRKCSLCGEKNVLFYCGNERAYTSDDAISLDHQSYKYMSEGEGLCAICFTKRFADKYFKRNYVRNYPSTVEIALMDSITELDGALLEEYRNIFYESFDEELFYEDNLTEEYFRKKGYSAEKLDAVKSKLDKIRKIAQERNLNWSKYYAILALDGDNMGKWVSGEFLSDQEELLEFQKELTKSLSFFAQSVERIIDEPKGKVVYAGGDDVLAFVNLTYLLSVVKELRKSFPDFRNLGFEVVDSQRSSASAGIAIAHYKTPLSEVLKWARRMEKEEAKSIDNKKDAFAIAVVKRSGETRKTVLKWQYDDLSVIDIMENLIESLRRNDFSSTFIRNLAMEFRQLMNEKGKHSDGFKELKEISRESPEGPVPPFFPLIKTEIKRLIDRSCMMEIGRNETESELLRRKRQLINDLVGKLSALYANTGSLGNFLSFLDIADFIARGGN